MYSRGCRKSYTKGSSPAEVLFTMLRVGVKGTLRKKEKRNEVRKKKKEEEEELGERGEGEEGGGRGASTWGFYGTTIKPQGKPGLVPHCLEARRLTQVLPQHDTVTQPALWGRGLVRGLATQLAHFLVVATCICQFLLPLWLWNVWVPLQEE